MPLFTMIENYPITAVRVFVTDMATAKAFDEGQRQLSLKIDGEKYGFYIFQLKGCDLIPPCLVLCATSQNPEQ